jgi:hypothetical protein
LLPRLDKVAGSHTPLEGLMPADPVGRRLQADYIARNPNPVGEKDRLLAAPGGSRYDAAHARYHPLFKRAANTVGFYDINLMDAATGDVVYTVVKETDFGSNIAMRTLCRNLRRQAHSVATVAATCCWQQARPPLTLFSSWPASWQ